MRIKSVTVENYRSYKEKKTFTFDEGINVIQAPNGSGKTTLISVIELLIFNKGPKKLEHLCNYHTNKNSFFVALELSHDNDDYYVSLDFTKGKTNTSKRVLKKNGVEIATNSEVNNFLGELFNIPVMTYALISGQRKAEIIDCQDSERRELLKKVQNLDYTNKVKNQIDPVITELKDKITEIEKEIFLYENKTYDFAEVPVQSITEEEYQKKKEELTKAQSKIDSLKTDASSVKFYEKEISELNNSITNKKEAVADIEVDIEALEESHKKAADTYETQIQNKQDELTTAQTKVNGFSVEAKLEELKARHAVAEKAVTDELTAKKADPLFEKIIEDPEKFNDSMLQNYREEVITLKTEIKQLEANKQQLADGTCPVCRKPFKAYDSEQFDQEITAKRKDLEAAENKVTIENRKQIIHEKKEHTKDTERQEQQELKQSVWSLEDRLSVLKEANRKELANKKGELERELVQLKANETALEISIKELTEVLVNKRVEYTNTKLKETSKKEKLLEEAKELEEKLITATKNKETIEVNIKGLPELEKELEEVKLVIEAYEATEKEITRITKENRKLKLQEKKDKGLLKEQQALLDKTTEERNDHQVAKDVLLKEFPNFVIDQKIDEIAYDMNKFIEQVYDKELGIQFKKNKTSIRLVYGEGGQQIDVKGGLSGAEKKLCQLAFIDSFNQQLGLGCLLLDEPGESSDADNTEKMYNLLGDMDNVYKQLIIITHKKEMKEYLVQNYGANIVEI